MAVKPKNKIIYLYLPFKFRKMHHYKSIKLKMKIILIVPLIEYSFESKNKVQRASASFFHWLFAKMSRRHVFTKFNKALGASFLNTLLVLPTRYIVHICRVGVLLSIKRGHTAASSTARGSLRVVLSFAKCLIHRCVSII